MSRDFEGVENDLAAITYALRRLVEAGSLEDSALIESSGGRPERLSDPTNTVVVTACIHPVRLACDRLAAILFHYLGTLIGKAAARDQYDSLVAEQRASPDVQAGLRKVEQGSCKLHPLTPASIH